MSTNGHVAETALDLTCVARILEAEEVNHAYFAERSVLPGATLFFSERADAPEFDLAVLSGVPDAEADAVLAAILCHYRERGRRPRVRLTPLSTPTDWPDRLERAGLVELDEPRHFITLPEAARPIANPAVTVRRVRSSEDVERFAAVQVGGFAVPPAQRDWDRELALRRLASGLHLHYLASIDGQPVGSARATRLPGGEAGLYSLATLPEARRHGVGGSLMQRMIEDARAAGCSLIFGTVRLDNVAARLYARLGFVSSFPVRTFAMP